MGGGQYISNIIMAEKVLLEDVTKAMTKRQSLKEGWLDTSHSQSISGILFHIWREMHAHFKPSWVVDISASYHITLHIKFFKMYKTWNFGTVKMGNIGFTKIIITGDVEIKTNVRHIVTLKNVRYVLNFWLNMLLEIAFEKEG